MTEGASLKSGGMFDDLINLNFTKEVSAGKALELVLKYVTINKNLPIGYTIDEEGNVFINVVDKAHDYTNRTYYIEAYVQLQPEPVRQ